MRGFDARRELAASPSPAATVEALPESRRREVFFQLPDTVRESLVDDVDADQLHRVVRRSDPDEAAYVLGFFISLGLAKWVLEI